MSAPAAPTEPADYGLDAPGVVRNLLLATAAGAAVWVAAMAGLLPTRLIVPVGGSRLIFPLAMMGAGPALGCGFMAGWMIWSSKVGKLRAREKLLDHLPWRGDERVLDVGCGRGLMLIGAAKRLTAGRASGIDIWQQEDLAGNRPEATQRNAEREGVAARVDIQSADMRSLPFGDATFDVVVSKAAIHNIYSADGRAQAIGEIARVLKPGGQALIDDIRHHREYLAAFASHGCPEAHELSSPAVRVLLFFLTFGSLRPAVLLVKKS